MTQKAIHPMKKRTGIVTAAVALAAVAAGAWWALDHREPETAGAPAVARRLTQDQYRTIIADVFGPGIDIGGRFELDVRQDGLLAVGTGRVSVTASGLEQYDKMARTIAAQVVDARNRSALIPCTPAAPAGPDDACARQFLAGAGRLLYRRALEKDELDSQVQLAGAAAQQLKSFYAGLATSLSTMLVAPQFLFRDEVAEPDPSHPGKWRLDGWSKASQLSFFLWNSAPDPELLAAAETGELHTREGLERQIDRMLASPRLEAGIRAFFADMLGFDQFETLAKDPLIYPKFTFKVADDAREQTLRTITNHLLTEKGDYRDLFTTPKTFLTPLLASLYQVPVAVPDGGWMPYSFAEGDPRSGILMQASFMALHSHPGRSSPTLRGKALREVLLCQTVPLPPANVNFSIVQDTKNEKLRTVRERLTAHATDATCAGCHKVIDPIGLAMENFDAAGSFRTSENGAAIDTSGELDGAKFTTPTGLGQAVHDSPAAPSCVANRLFAYGVGHPAGKEDGAWVAWLDKRFAASGYRLPALLKTIAESDAFYRALPPDSPPPVAAHVAQSN
jgi:hypothetical protein